MREQGVTGSQLNSSQHAPLPPPQTACRELLITRGFGGAGLGLLDCHEQAVTGGKHGAGQPLVVAHGTKRWDAPAGAVMRAQALTFRLHGSGRAGGGGLAAAG